MSVLITLYKITINPQVRMSKAEQNKKYLQKLKTTPKYDEFKSKRAAKMRNFRNKKLKIEDGMPLNKFVDVVEKRRHAVRERVRKCRERKRQHKAKENISNDKESCSLNTLASAGYRCVQTLGKAVSKVVQAFPSSPKRKKAVLASIVEKMLDVDKLELADAIRTPAAKKKYVPNKTIDSAIKKFYIRDDISRVSPKARDVKEYLCPDSGNKMLLPTRHMELTIREAFALFDEEQKTTKQGN
jgi:hypothetical protein